MILPNKKMYSITPRKKLLILLAMFFTVISLGQTSFSERKEQGGKQGFILDNGIVASKLYLNKGKLLVDSLSFVGLTSSENGSPGPVLITDADFLLEVIWTGWKAPGKENNADNILQLTKEDFVFQGCEQFNESEGGYSYAVFLKGIQTPFQLRLVYSLGEDDNFSRRRIDIRDTIQSLHFLHKISSRDGKILRSINMQTGKSNISILKEGGFGQPAALTFPAGGAFLGMEYPLADNLASFDEYSNIDISCSDITGKKITTSWVQTEWVVTGITPDHAVRFHFMQYLDDVKVSPADPFTLYNSWYDLRSADYPDVPEEHRMNARNTERIIDLVSDNMIKNHHINLDAFVLDDGWDRYESEWELRRDQFPEGLKPLSEKLAKTNTGLGIWFGPTGGYSFRMERINHMKEIGYEVTGSETTWHTAMLCLGGKKYDSLFTARVLEMVHDEGVSYFKWDGIQFSCSEKGHGHPTGIYSRRAIFENVASLCDTVRKLNPEIYLNITSGTWLSPWWLKYANQIWMDAEDYGYGGAPSISPRDRAMSYRDMALYNDFALKDLWFPISNLMTHGIIKGRLQKLGGEQEPIDKFTNNAVLYFARGVSMWELYISPDILTEEEWHAIAGSIEWAKDRYDILKNTSLTGGDPGSGEPYAWVHFNGDRAIIAARNPGVMPRILKVNLDPAQGFGVSADSLVLDRVYPMRWIAPKLYTAGETVNLPLEGFETAIYEVYPLSSAGEPLVAGIDYEISDAGNGNYTLDFTYLMKKPVLLNPSIVNSLVVDGKEVNPDSIPPFPAEPPLVLENLDLKPDSLAGNVFHGTFTSGETVKSMTLAVLLESNGNEHPTAIPAPGLEMNGESIPLKTEEEKGKWAWHYTETGNPGNTELTITLYDSLNPSGWKGNLSVWLLVWHELPVYRMDFLLKEKPALRPLPPRPWKPGTLFWAVRVGKQQYVEMKNE